MSDLRERAAAFRADCRRGRWTGPTAGKVPGALQANLVILPATDATDFASFCQRNPRPCPLVEVTKAGNPEPVRLAPDADLRTDLPLYRIYQAGEPIDDVNEIASWWRDDLVAFLIGCSFTFEAAFQRHGLPVRHLEEEINGHPKNVPMYRTKIDCTPAGAFRGPLVVSMRPMLPEDARRAAALCESYPQAHGPPVHIGNSEAIGIHRLDRPDWGDRVTIRRGEVPVFWACGVTPQAAIAAAKPTLCITHAPGHMFVTDWPEDVKVRPDLDTCPPVP